MKKTAILLSFLVGMNLVSAQEESLQKRSGIFVLGLEQSSLQ